LFRYSDRQALKSLPGLLELSLLLRRRFRHRLATASTLLCVEAFPRSGTGYTVALALDGLQVAREHIASNTHSIANIKRAVARDVPTFVLIRDALQSCLSLMVWGGSRDLSNAMNAYHQFYSGLLPIIDRVTIVPFDILIDRPDRVFESISRSLGKDVSWNKDRAHAIERARAKRDEAALRHRSSLPSAAKDELKKSLLRQQSATAVERQYARCETLRAYILAAAPNKIGADRDAAVSAASPVC
jgi:hypothetical protein